MHSRHWLSCFDWCFIIELVQHNLRSSNRYVTLVCYDSSQWIRKETGRSGLAYSLPRQSSVSDFVILLLILQVWSFGGSLDEMRLTVWDFKFSRRRVWCSELSSGLYCRVKWLSAIILHGSTTQKTALNNAFNVSLFKERVLLQRWRQEEMKIWMQSHYTAVWWIVSIKQSMTINF
jgi:hypothetical protein